MMAAMPKETMTPKERWGAVLKRLRPDRVPMDYWATPETTFKLMDYLACRSKKAMLEKLHVDYVIQAKPRYVGPKIPRGYDVFGCRYEKMDYGTGLYKENISHPLANFRTVGEVKRHYTWPDPDWWDYSAVASRLERDEDHCVQAGLYEPFLVYKNLRGDMQAYMDLVEHPDLVHYCLDQLLHLSFTEIQRLYDQIPGRVFFTYVAEDMGGQSDLLISPEHIREFLLPRMKEVINFVHKAGAYVFHHNDGSVRCIIPDMIAAGIDILNPIQWRCAGMDRDALKQEFGSRVVFHGGMDNQHTLAFGTAEEVRQEVLDNLRILGRGGGYILAPCHNIQPITPPENIVAMYDTGYEHGWT